MNQEAISNLVKAAETAASALSALTTALAPFRPGPSEFQTDTILEADDWQIVATGGQCSAYQKTSHADKTVYAWITADNGIHHFSPEGRYTVCLYTEIEGVQHIIIPRASDGPRLKAVTDPTTLAECMAWANERLFEPDLFSHLWDEV